MRFSLTALIALSVFLLTSCEKEPVPNPPANPGFVLHINNEFGPLEAEYAVFLSDAQGKIRAYRAVAGQDTARLTIPEAATTDRFDCTITRITTIDAPGSGIKDTSITLTTYTSLPSGETVNLRNWNYQQTTDLFLSFAGMTTFDSIIVPDGLTFVRPQAANNYSGHYQVLHTGNIWFRILADGDPHWRYLTFNNVSNPTLTAPIQVGQLPLTFVPPTQVTLPFSAAWQYKLDGVIDSSKRQFLPLGDLRRAPGGAVPVYNTLSMFEPVLTDDFGPAPRPYSSFRLRTSGEDGSPGGYNYTSDRFYKKLPASLPTPDFDLAPTILSDKSLVAVQCVGQFEVLALTRVRNGTPNITWEVYTRPANGTVTYGLPDVPAALGSRFPALKNYDFGDLVRVRAERYEQSSGYESIIHQRLLNADPLWQAKAGYLGREEVY